MLQTRITQIARQLRTGPIDRPEISVPELVVVVASLWALNAFAIDMMLPALGTISDDLGASTPNDRQLLIIVYIIFNGFAQLFFGPLVDRFGRRTILLWSLAGYVIASLLSVIAMGFTFMLVTRGIQGITTAGTRVAAMAVIRDRFEGRRMAQIMSLIVTVFMIAPIIAPGIGQLVLAIGPWRWIFATLLFYGIVLYGWVAFRVAETQKPEQRTVLAPNAIVANYREFFSHRISLGYTLAGAFVFASLFAYISASEQIFLETFKLGNLFALAFAIIALPLGLATIVNSQLVRKHGMRKISHLALILFIITSISHFIVNAAELENVFWFLGFMAIAFFALGMMGPNFTAMAMEPMGHIAGSASAANGFASTAISGVIGGLIARAYDGTPGPVILGMAIMGIISLCVILLAERGHMFEAAAHRQDDKSNET